MNDDIIEMTLPSTWLFICFY